MLKNIFAKLNSWYLEKFQDTTKESEEYEDTPPVSFSKYQILVSNPLWERIKFLFTNKMAYRLTKHQFVVIKNNPLKEGI